MRSAGTEILMCAPTHFSVDYVVNPWMEGNVGKTRADVARRQWEQLYNTLVGLSKVQLIEPADQLPDMCFVANAGVVLGDVFVPASFRVPQRAPEVPHYRQWFADRGYYIADLPDAEFLEGEGDALIDPERQLIWAGYGPRSLPEAHRSLAMLLALEVVSLRLVDERFFHLDTCFAPLSQGRVIYYPGAFDELSRREIERRVPAAKRLLVSEADALRFACNSVRIDNTIICGYAGPELRRRLGAWGYQVITTPLDEFLRSGGAAKCMCLTLQQQVRSESAARGVKPRYDALLEV